MEAKNWVKGVWVVAVLWGVSVVIDRLWFAIDQSVPAWDQAEYLTGAMNFWRAFQQPEWFSAAWWTKTWMLSSKIPPLVYLSTALFIHVFGADPDRSTLVNLLYSAILFGSVYGLGVRLFNVQVGVWATALCLILPGLYTIRLDYLIDYPLVAIVTLAFFCLTLWATEFAGDRQIKSVPQPAIAPVTQSLAFAQSVTLPDITDLRSWLYASAFGVAFGLALLTKQPAVFFLLVPIAWISVVTLRQRWRRLVQLGVAGAIALLICLPWYRTNWLIIFTAGKRATVDSAIAEGDPSLASLDAWIFYLKALPALVSMPIFVVGFVGLLLYWKRSIIQQHWLILEDRWIKTTDYGGLRRRGYRREIYHAWLQSVRWLLVFLIGSYLLCSLNINKDDRYITPLLPVLAILLAQGLILFPDRLRFFRIGAIALAIILMIANLLPIQYSPNLQTEHDRHAVLSSNWHQAEIVSEVIDADPYLQHTIGVLPSLAEFNQHNLNYYGVLRNFQVYGRQLGTNLKQIEQDARSLNWYVTKDGNGGAIRRPEAYTKLNAAIANSPDLRLQRSWSLPDQSRLNLYRRSLPTFNVEPKQATKQIKLEQIRTPNQIAPGQPALITYRWSGAWEQLRSGIVLLSWTQAGDTTGTKRWLHDHAIALGTLQPDAADDRATFQVTERLATLPPADAQGSYTLQAAYLNRITGATYAIDVPDVQLTIAPTASTPSDPDFVTQLRSLAATMPQGLKALDRIFAEVGKLNQYDPVQDYVTQTQQILEYRLQQEPSNLEFAYGLALTNVLKRRVQPAIDALERVVQLDAKNPAAYAYLAFVNLYDFRARAAQKAINSAIALNPNLHELHTLNAVAGLMQGNLVQAWREFQTSK